MAIVLFVFAHPDDETLGACVPIAEHVAAGHEVHVLWLTRGEASAVLNMLNGVTTSTWWGLLHRPVDEGYLPLDPITFASARIAEATAAVRCLSSGLGTVGLHEGGLPDGGVTQAAAEAAILATVAVIAPLGEPVRLKGHTWMPQLDNHPDHVAVGAAIKALGTTDPVHFGDRRYYILPFYWADPDLTLVAEVWDSPAATDDIADRAINAIRCFGAWAPDRGSYAIGEHSVSSWFATLRATPRSMVHK
jgi:Uncharacterized proteins, LmbE homologs